MGRFCNTGTQSITGVQAFIGDYANRTPGIYPSRDSSTFGAEHPALLDSGLYSFTHVGGRRGTADATRFVGTIPAGECRVQYWTVKYPQCENSEDPPCSEDPVWGDSVKPDDDLWLTFDIWATAEGGYDAYETWTMTMRNEISAMANKIEPNGNPGGRGLTQSRITSAQARSSPRTVSGTSWATSGLGLTMTGTWCRITMPGFSRSAIQATTLVVSACSVPPALSLCHVVVATLTK
jgi:hypothetical protein